MCEVIENVVEEVSDIATPAVEIERLFEEYVDFDTLNKSDFRVVKIKECSAVKKRKKFLFDCGKCRHPITLAANEFRKETI